MCTVESARDPSGCRASGLTPGRRAGSAVVGSIVVGSAAASFSGAGSAAASSSGAGADGATSTASRLLFSGWSSEVSSSLAVVVTQKLRILLVPATTLSMYTLLLSFLKPLRHRGLQARTFIQRIHHNEVEQDTF